MVAEVVKNRGAPCSIHGRSIVLYGPGKKMEQGINFGECTSKKYEGKGSKLEYKLEDAMPEYSVRPYLSARQAQSTKYYRGN